MKTFLQYPINLHRYLKSTIGNIELISKFRKRAENAEVHPEEQIFNFWVEYFDDACKEETKDFIRFPVSRKQTFETFIYRAR